MKQKRFNSMSRLALGLITCAALTHAGHSAVTVNFIDEGTQVRIIVSGSISVAGLTISGTPPPFLPSSSVNNSPAIVGRSVATMIDPGLSPTIANAIATNQYLGASPSINTFAAPGAPAFPPPLIITGGTVANLADLPLICINNIANDVIISDALVQELGAPLPGAAPVYETTIPGNFASLNMLNGIVSSTLWDNSGVTESITFTTIPEPSTMALLLPLIGFGALRRRRS